jgi:agmatine deiminase
LNLSAKFQDKALPRALGYRMPAEWEPHRATWLAWPHNFETWPDPSELERVKEIWVRMVRAISPVEEVCLLVRDAREKAETARLLEADVPRRSASRSTRFPP